MIQEYQMETAQFGRAQKTLRGPDSANYSGGPEPETDRREPKSRVLYACSGRKL